MMTCFVCFLVVCGCAIVWQLGRIAEQLWELSYVIKHAKFVLDDMTKVLTAIGKQKKQDKPVTSVPTPFGDVPVPPSFGEIKPIYTLTGKIGVAQGVRGPNNKGMIVLTGSLISKDTTSALRPDVIALRQQALDQGSMVDPGSETHYTLIRDVPFTSLVRAASFVLGNPTGGGKEWKDEYGCPLRQVEAAAKIKSKINT